jgi:hypothetical protein
MSYYSYETYGGISLSVKQKNNIKIILVLIVMLAIICLFWYGVYKLFKSAPVSSENKSNNNAPKIYYDYVYGPKLWNSNKPNEYTCPNARNVYLKEDYAKYCIFNNSVDVMEWCSSDSNCIGYIKDSGKYHALDKEPVKNIEKYRSKFYRKKIR